MRWLAGLALLAHAASAQTAPEREPSLSAKGKVSAWQKRKDLGCYYRVPKDYGKKRGCPLVVLLLGHEALTGQSGIFARFDQALERHVLFVQPGPLVREARGFRNQLRYEPKRALADRVRALVAEFRTRFNLPATYLVGSGSGAAFALYYGALFPDEVQGIVAASPPFWPDAAPHEKQKSQAILLERIYVDPRPADAVYRVAPRLRALGLPALHVRLAHEVTDNPPSDRTHIFLHAPLAQDLAWCEAMTASDPRRLAEAFERACVVPSGRKHFDIGQLYRLALRTLAPNSPATKRTKARAKRIRADIERLAERQKAAILKSVGTNRELVFDGREWTSHGLAFLDGFVGVPARDKLEELWRPHLQRHRAAAKIHRAVLDKAREKDPKAAFAAATAIIRECCLDTTPFITPYAYDLVLWRGMAVSKADIAVYDKYIEARRTGLRTYLTINAKFKP